MLPTPFTLIKGARYFFEKMLVQKYQKYHKVCLAKYDYLAEAGHVCSINVRYDGEL